MCSLQRCAELRLLVQVKQKHIDGGLRRKPQLCAVTLAIKDTINNSDARVVTGNETCHITIDDITTLYSHNCSEFIKNFDKKLKVFPCDVMLEQQWQTKKDNKLSKISIPLDLNKELDYALNSKSMKLTANIEITSSELIITDIKVTDISSKNNIENTRKDKRGARIDPDKFKKGYGIYTDSVHHSQRAIGEMIGVSGSTISKYKRHWNNIHNHKLDIDEYLASNMTVRSETYREPDPETIPEAKEETFDNIANDIDDDDSQADNINILNERQ